MKKILYSSTALAAASALALIPSGDAVAAEKAKKISLGFGGGMTMLAGFATQDDSFEKASADDTTGTTHYDNFNLWSNTEVEVKGSVKLDSGITVSVEVEFEGDQVIANGANLGAGTAANGSGMTIDHSYMKIHGGFGDVYLGNYASVTGILHQSAPWTGALYPGVDDFAWIMKPAAIVGQGQGKYNTSNGGNDTQAVQYISPQFAGARVGMYYRPSSAAASWEGMPRVGGQSGNESQEYGASINYENKFDAVTIKASVAHVKAQGTAANSVNTTFFGGRILFGDITIGGSFKKESNEDTGLEGTADSDESEGYDFGVMFKPKGYSVGLHYVHFEMPEASATAGDDSKTAISLGAAYDLGPGVSAVGTLIWVDYEDELTNDSNNNSGWAIVGGIKVAF